MIGNSFWVGRWVFIDLLMGGEKWQKRRAEEQPYNRSESLVDPKKAGRRLRRRNGQFLWTDGGERGFVQRPIDAGKTWKLVLKSPLLPARCAYWMW